VRASTGTATSRANCHPFAHGRWLFMHNGQIGGWHGLRRTVEAMLPDDRYAARRGTTDSEAIFLMLDDAALARDPVGAMREALARIRRAMDAAGIAEPLRFAAALSDGRSLYAFRYASDQRPPTLYFREADGDVTVVSEPLDGDRDGWRALAPMSALVVDTSGGIRFEDFDVEAAAGLARADAA
jgi:predicted glutamine amidotransferase